jgi:hypothetical protein
MKAGLDYKKLMDFFVAQALQEKEQDAAHAFDLEEPTSGTFIERVTIKRNGEVQISSWERLPESVRGCERYTYWPRKQDLKNLERAYGPIKRGDSKTSKRVWLGGRWV